MFGFYVILCFLFSFICNVWMLNRREEKKKRKKREKWGRGVNCKKEMREKNEMSEGECV